MKCKECQMISKLHMKIENLERKVLSTGKMAYTLFHTVLILSFSLHFKCLIKLHSNKCPHRYWHRFKNLGFKSHRGLRYILNNTSVSILL